MKYGKGIFAGAVTAVLGVKTAAAQFIDTASAGNGGVATASATAAPFLPATSTAVATSVARSRSATPAARIRDQVYGGDILNQTGFGRRSRRRHGHRGCHWRQQQPGFR